MALLTQQEILDIANAMIASGIDTNALRGTLFRGINPFFFAGIPGGLPANAQLLMDLGFMNMVERLANGDIPLEIYLRNADFLLAGAPVQQNIIKEKKQIVIQRASGAPKIDITQVPERKQVIIYKNDMVTYGFMQEAVKAGAAVMKLKVPSFENGTQRTLPGGDFILANGTAWLLTGSLIMTNHHVINARKEEEPPATVSDLKLQAQHTKAILDFDSDLIEGSVMNTVSLEGWDETLDYAILRVPATNRRPLRRAAAAVSLGNEPIPVNIIQHPGGLGKRYAIRNNLVSAATTNDLRYFTDTESGSSGSPVLNDQWQVVALHRASLHAQNVQFQGKTTAYINVGTQLTAILAHVQQHFPSLANEIESHNNV
ncbi:trypsin-like peptidase domain-containing protein [Chitinophaga agrisoli]|uniref:Trypsin-like peptidase domain-containing protein n=1 Tax=Chitinophaga agrisoli TaxID=2607653 RepID=A0A5B2VJQ4_9BACT|nr:trypsin-like peptidase domain-containing protein [Chitinophaga agrisoli]KAA2238776.1 trypsin-like peptidase domain-containing protein [Chitinophaga agrisoli]